MIADAPKTAYKNKEVEEFESDEDLASWLGAE